jgi:hypothetical protein
MEWLIALGAIAVGVLLLAWATGRADRIDISKRPRQLEDPRYTQWRFRWPRRPEPEDYLPPEAAAEVRRAKRDRD